MGQLLQITHVSDDSSVAMDKGLADLVASDRGDRTSMNSHEQCSGECASGTRCASISDRVERSHAHFIKLCELQASADLCVPHHRPASTARCRQPAVAVPDGDRRSATASSQPDASRCDRARLGRAPHYRPTMEYFDRHRAHPWHGLTIGDSPPHVVDAYIEITPYDAVKYEIDKRSGYLRVDRPQGS